MKFHTALALILLPLSAGHMAAQTFDDYFSGVVMRMDTAVYRYPENQLRLNDRNHFYFPFTSDMHVAEFELTPHDISVTDSISLLPSGDFEVIDSLIMVTDGRLRVKVSFNDLTNSDFLKLTFALRDTGSATPAVTELRLFPYTETWVRIYPLSDELFIGEEKVFELVSNNIDNVRFSGDWKETNGLNYRITKTFNQLQLHVVPNTLGTQRLSVPLKAKKPSLDSMQRPVYDLEPVEYTFTVNQSRLQFLNVNRRDVTLDDSTRSKGVELQIDNHRLLRMQKTYRIEAQEEAGGALIGELFTRNSLTNNRVLCWLRVFNYHRESDGYLYIKDGDDPLFITNFNITPQTAINRVRILREGQWSGNLTVYPGETIDVKIEGEALHKAEFVFEELVNVSSDTLIFSETAAQYQFRVPMDINKKRLAIYNLGKNTGHSLVVKEYQLPRPFDFVWLNYGEGKQTLNGLPGTILVDKTVPDIIFGSDRRLIDSEEQLYGVQYLKIEITVTGKRNELIEMKTIDDVVICPGINSPRYEHYDDKKCGPVYFDINSYLRKKTHTLDIWSKIEIKVSHQEDKYQESGYSKEFEIIMKADYSFDIDLSFPAGLITVSKPDENQEKLGSLSGVSIAMIAQFTFYHPEKINTPRPYKIGAGFLALNTFNFSDNNNSRDLGIVVLGSLYPTTRDVKLTFPLYVGAGYFLDQEKLFFLVGPGIRIRF